MSTTSSADKAELRQLASIATLTALDAIAMTEGMTRSDYINRLLDGHARQKLHKASVLVRTTRGNPLLEDEPGGAVA